MDKTIDISVAVPNYSEEENIHELYKRLTAVLDDICSKRNKKNNEVPVREESDYEIVMVDDGSKDNTWRLIKELNMKDPRIKGLSFSMNFGHHIAITAGLDYANGEAVIMMDGDLQEPPKNNLRFYYDSDDEETHNFVRWAQPGAHNSRSS